MPYPLDIGAHGSPWAVGAVVPTFGPLSLGDAAELLQGLYGVNVAQFQRGAVPSVLARIRPGSAGPGRRAIRYIRTDNREHWKTARELVGDGYGDCEDLAAAVAAEFTVRGVPARPVIKRIRPGLAHALVQLQNGAILDPSKIAGMGETPLGARA